MEDQKWGERPVALVVKGGDVDEDAIKELVSQYADKGVISRYGIPDRVVFVDELPRTSVGKLDRKKMRAEMVGHHPPGPASAGPLFLPDEADFHPAVSGNGVGCGNHALRTGSVTWQARGVRAWARPGTGRYPNDKPSAP